MRKTFVILTSIFLAFVGFGVGGFVGSEDNNVISGIVGIVCALAFSFGYYYYRKNKEKCKKCGALWSVKLSSTETLTQSAISETKRVGSTTDFNNIVEHSEQGGRRYGSTDVYKTTNYLVGEERLIYRCDKCGDEVSKIQKYKRTA